MKTPSVNWLDQANVLIHVRSPSGKILYRNKASGHFYGWAVASGQDPLDAGDLDLVQPILEEVGRAGGWSGDYERNDVQGNTFVLESHWSAILDEEGRPEGILVLEVDVSDSRLSRANLLRAQRMESIGALAGGVAHDINNVLGPILIGAEMIRRKSNDPWVREKLEGIEASARRGAEIVRQVLDFSRGAEGEKIVMQVRHLLKEVVSFSQRTFSKSIEISSDIQRNLKPISGDAALLQQCIMNIMVNARDAMPGGGSVTVSAMNVTLTAQEAQALSHDGRAGEFVRINISDTGTGIDPESLDRIFVPFFTTKVRAQGTGLGLSSSLSIIQGHQGFISVHSEVGSGTTFSLYLPAQHHAEPDTVVPDKSLGDREQRVGRILVVEDEPMMRTMNRDLLESVGYEVLLASNGVEGIAVFERDPFGIDVIITDVNMPVMDGLTMIREIRKRRPEVPFITTSGLSDLNQIEKENEFRNILILYKPYTSAQLLESVARKLNPEPPAGGSADPNDVLSEDDFDQLMGGEDW